MKTLILFLVAGLSALAGDEVRRYRLGADTLKKVNVVEGALMPLTVSHPPMVAVVLPGPTTVISASSSWKMTAA